MGTSKLQQQVGKTICSILEGCRVQENIRPEWLIIPDGERCELDFYIESLGIAIEVQGAQHYIYVPHFHQTYENFLRQTKRDSFKRYTCQKRGIRLYEISSESELDELIASIKQAIQPKPTFDRRKKIDLVSLAKLRVTNNGDRKQERRKGIIRAGTRILDLINLSTVPDHELGQLIEVLAVAAKKPQKQYARFLTAYAGWIRLFKDAQTDTSQEIIEKLAHWEQQTIDARQSAFIRLFGRKKVDSDWTPRRYEYF